MNPVSEITAPIGLILGLLVVGFGGTYWYLKDKILISSGPGALFDFVVWKCFGTFAVVGAIVGYIAGGLLGSLIVWVLGYWYILAIAAGWVAYILTGKNMNKALAVGGVVAILGFGANSYLQSKIDPNMKSNSRYASVPVKNNPSTTQKSSSNNNTSKSEKHLFDGSKYGLDDLTPEEQDTADFIMRNRNGSADDAYNFTMMGRQSNGGKPLDRSKGMGITDDTIPSGAPLQSGDLMIGNIALGEPFDLVSTKKMGYPFQVKEHSTVKNNDSQGLYDNFELNYNDVIVSLTASNSNLKTPRGIHPKSSLNDVMKAYGKNYDKLGKEDMNKIADNFKKESQVDLYNDFYKNTLNNLSDDFRSNKYSVIRYKANSKSGKAGSICFVIDNKTQQVYYMSIFYDDKDLTPLAFRP